MELIACNFNHSMKIWVYFSIHVIPHPEKVAKGGEDAYYADE